MAAPVDAVPAAPGGTQPAPQIGRVPIDQIPAPQAPAPQAPVPAALPPTERQRVPTGEQSASDIAPPDSQAEPVGVEIRPPDAAQPDADESPSGQTPPRTLPGDAPPAVPAADRIPSPQQTPARNGSRQPAPVEPARLAPTETPAGSAPRVTARAKVPVPRPADDLVNLPRPAAERSPPAPPAEPGQPTPGPPPTGPAEASSAVASAAGTPPTIEPAAAGPPASTPPPIAPPPPAATEPEPAAGQTDARQTDARQTDARQTDARQTDAPTGPTQPPTEPDPAPPTAATAARKPAPPAFVTLAADSTKATGDAPPKIVSPRMVPDSQATQPVGPDVAGLAEQSHDSDATQRVIAIPLPRGRIEARHDASAPAGAAAEPTAAAPARSARGLLVAPVRPVPAHRQGSPAAPRKRSRIPIVLLNVVLALVILGGSAALVVAFLTSEPRGDRDSDALPSSSAPPAIRLTVDDRAATVNLSWTDPSSGRVPFVVTYGRADGPADRTERVAAGTTTLAVNQLDPAQDYCFTVEVGDPAPGVAPSPTVCTSRARPGASPSR
jgi:hypothetical protein